ncbi:MAG: LPS export ABC transporter permease LptG [Nitrospinaceae bacterium]
MILKRYILTEFFRLFLLSACGLVGIFLIGDFFERVDEFVSRGVPAWMLLAYYFYKIPFAFFFMAPQAVLLATVIAIASLSKNNEITAIKASGISVTGITLPIVGGAMLIALLVLASNEYIAPVTSKKMNHIFFVQVRGRATSGKIIKDKIWYKSKAGTIWNVENFDPQHSTLKGVSIFITRDDQFIQKRIDSAKAVWKDNRWEFIDGFVRSFGPEGLEKTEFFEKNYFPFSEIPSDFQIIKKRPEEMNLRKLYEEILAWQSEGKDVSKKWVDLHHKISYPFIAIVMALIGIPLSLRTSRHGGVLFSVALNLSLGIFFSFLYAMGISLGRGGTFGPVLAAWGPLALFTSIGFYLILTIDSETLLPFRK